MVDPGHNHIFVVSTDGGTPRQLTGGEYDHGNPIWTPDGNAILFTANKHENADLCPNYIHIYELDLDTGDQQKLSDSPGAHRNPQLSPDGNHIAFTGFKDQFIGYQLTRLFAMDRDGSNLFKNDTKLDKDIGTIHLDATMEGISFQYNDEGSGYIAHTSLDENHRLGGAPRGDCHGRSITVITIQYLKTGLFHLLYPILIKSCLFKDLSDLLRKPKLAPSILVCSRFVSDTKGLCLQAECKVIDVLPHKPVGCL